MKDFRRAVLIAAIACEVKVKEVLRQAASEDQRSLLDFALDNPREVTVTAADGLFDKLMLATAGRSLRQDDRQLFRHIQELYTVRNRVAHSGRLPDKPEAGRVVRAAGGASSGSRLCNSPLAPTRGEVRAKRAVFDAWPQTRSSPRCLRPSRFSTCSEEASVALISPQGHVIPIGKANEPARGFTWRIWARSTSFYLKSKSRRHGPSEIESA